MPDASGKFKGISVPSIPWQEKGHGMVKILTDLERVPVIGDVICHEDVEYTVSAVVLAPNGDLVHAVASPVLGGTSHEPATP